MSSKFKVNTGAHRLMRAAGVCAMAAGLAACASGSKPMYNWQSYQAGVYTYLQDDGADYAAQIQTLEANIQQARARDEALPPGFHAHLGLLYLKLGEDNRAVELLQKEKQSFPESTVFMDFLMRNLTPSDEQPAGDTVPSQAASQEPLQEDA